MTSGRRTGWDPFAVIAVVVTVAMTAGYVWLISQQGGRPVAWFVGGLVGSALLGTYGAARAAPLQGTALTISGVTLFVLGVVGILSVGLPILAAGMLALVAAVRSAVDRGDRPTRSGLTES